MSHSQQTGEDEIISYLHSSVCKQQQTFSSVCKQQETFSPSLVKGISVLLSNGCLLIRMSQVVSCWQLESRKLQTASESSRKLQKEVQLPSIPHWMNEDLHRHTNKGRSAYLLIFHLDQLLRLHVRSGQREDGNGALHTIILSHLTAEETHERQGFRHTHRQTCR